ncbi:MAG: sigma-70 family RNA polymerase sigma factor [Tyzzerella sp.]|nr:sigma-70 family RNA polymerase sigma factor [Tyzzerella sp.]
MEREELISMVRAVQNGDEDSKTALYDTFHDNLYHYIMKTVKDPELALDLTQDAFIEIFQTINSLKEPAAFVTWSRKIAYHRCTAYFRKRRELLADEEEEGNSLFDTLVEEREEFIPDEALDKEDFKQTIHAMIQALPEEQRVAIMLRYFEELSVKEIAEIQGVTEGTVKSRLNYGRKAIKQAVESYEKKNGVKLHIVGVIPMLLWLFREYRIANGMPFIKKTETTVAKESAKVGVKLLAKKIVTGVVIATVVTGGVAAGSMLMSGTIGNSEASLRASLETEIEDWGNLDGDDIVYLLSEIMNYTQSHGYYELNDMEDSTLFTYTGLSDKSKMKNAVVTVVEPNEQVYALLIQVNNQEDIDVLVSEIKANLRPNEWIWYGAESGDDSNVWSDVFIEDFTFYTNGDFILVSSVDQSLVNRRKRLSTEAMNARLDVIVEEYESSDN